MVRVSSRQRLVRRARLAAPALGLALLLAACSDDAPTSGTATGSSAPAATGTAAPSRSAGGSPAPTTTAKPAPTKAGSTRAPSAPPVDTQAPAVAISTAPEVAVGSTAKLSNGVKVQVSKVSSVKVKATGPGDIAGNGVAVHVTVKNTSKQTFDLDGLVVTATYGKSKPASPGGAGNGDPLTGRLKVGSTGRGVYVFTVPKAQADSLEVQVSSNASALILTYRR